MRSLSMILITDSKSNIIERIRYFEEFREDYKHQLQEGSTKQETIRAKNREIKNLSRRIAYLEPKLEYLENNQESNQKRIRHLEKEINDYEKLYNQTLDKLIKETNDNQELKRRVDFLKNHRRAPSLEEIKDYELKRKRGNKNAK